MIGEIQTEKTITNPGKIGEDKTEAEVANSELRKGESSMSIPH